MDLYELNSRAENRIHFLSWRPFWIFSVSEVSPHFQKRYPNSFYSAPSNHVKPPLQILLIEKWLRTLLAVNLQG